MCDSWLPTSSEHLHPLYLWTSKSDVDARMCWMFAEWHCINFQSVEQFNPETKWQCFYIIYIFWHSSIYFNSNLSGYIWCMIKVSWSLNNSYCSSSCGYSRSFFYSINIEHSPSQRSQNQHKYTINLIGSITRHEIMNGYGVNVHETKSQYIKKVKHNNGALTYRQGN
jgi:hypothetical protein